MANRCGSAGPTLARKAHGCGRTAPPTAVAAGTTGTATGTRVSRTATRATRTASRCEATAAGTTRTAEVNESRSHATA
eukprot:7391388-Prymnesium_polylepis.2